jgi:hypothetical protein
MMRGPVHTQRTAHGVRDRRVSELRSIEEWSVAISDAADLAATSDLSSALRRAFRALHFRKYGRHALDDDDALLEMRRLLEIGLAQSVEAAAGLVAATRAGAQSRESATKRLARKFRSGFGTK